jgi:hypothetical protein
MIKDEYCNSVQVSDPASGRGKQPPQLIKDKMPSTIVNKEN